MYRAKSRASREQQDREGSAAFGVRLWQPRSKPAAPAGRGYARTESPRSTQGSRPPLGRTRAARDGGPFNKGWATMSLVHTAEISPADAKGEWAVVETEFEDRAILCVDCGQDFTWTA